jgi:hypothetical protein
LSEVQQATARILTAASEIPVDLQTRKQERETSGLPDDVGIDWKVVRLERIAMATRLMMGVAMIAVIVTIDVLIFRNHFWERLMVNIGIVLVFAAFYLRFLRHP